MLASGTVQNSRDILNYYQEYAEKECGWTPTPDDCRELGERTRAAIESWTPPAVE